MVGELSQSQSTKYRSPWQILSISLSHRDVDSPGGVTLDDVPADGGHPRVWHPHWGQREVRHVQECVPGDEVIPPPAVRVLSQEPGGEGFEEIVKRFYCLFMQIVIRMEDGWRLGLPTHRAKTLIVVCWNLVWQASSSSRSSMSLLLFSSNFLVCSSKWSRQLLRNSAALFW